MSTLQTMGMESGELGQVRDREASRLRRRMQRFRDAGMFDESNPELHVGRALSYDDLCQAYALVHSAYVRNGYIRPQPSGMRIRIYEALPETAVCIAKVGTRVVGVLSVVPDSPDAGLPSDKVFGKEINSIRESGRRVAEVTNLAIADDFRSTAVFLQLSRYLGALAVSRDFDDLFVAISPGHSIFFETLMGFVPWGAKRCYDDHTRDVVEGMRLNWSTFTNYAQWADTALGEQHCMSQWFLHCNPFTSKVAGDDLIANRQFRNMGVLYDLFIRRSSLLRDCTIEQRAALRRRWGPELFDSLYHLAMSSNEVAA